MLQRVGYSGHRYQGPLISANVVYRGKPQDIAEIMAKLTAAIAQDDRLIDYIELARINRIVGRLRKAKGYYQQVYEKMPNAIEAGLGLAFIEVAKDSYEVAFKILRELLDKQDKWYFYRPDKMKPGKICKEFVQLYNNLHQHLSIKSHPPLDMSAFDKYQNIGRNDPCLCGSGKKYKKCCLLEA